MVVEVLIGGGNGQTWHNAVALLEAVHSTHITQVL